MEHSQGQKRSGKVKSCGLEGFLIHSLCRLSLDFTGGCARIALRNEAL